MKASDLTTIVGDNDSGKSNILRALNLFFNGETDPGLKLDFDKDFNRFVQLNKQAPQIEVELTLELPEGYRANNGDMVRWKKAWRQEGSTGERDWTGLRSEGMRRGRERFSEVPIEPRSRVPALLSRIEFEYVPAVRSADFFRRMRGRIYRVIADVAEEGFRERSGDFERAIGEQVEPLLSSLLDDMRESTSLRLPNDLSAVFEELDFLSGEKSISLNNRGDGIKGRYIPHILKFIAEKKQQLYGKGAQPYTFIWAYEEPENNLEIRRAQEFAEFLKILSSKQLMQAIITTHSPIFFNLRNQYPELCTAIFVSRGTDELGTSTHADTSTLDALNERMGVMEIVAPHMQKALEDIRELQESSDRLRSEIEAHNKQNLPTLFVEGQTDFSIINKLIEVRFPEALDKICILEPRARAGASYVSNSLIAWEFKTRSLPAAARTRSHGILDGDEAGVRAAKQFSDCKPKHCAATTLSLPPHLKPAVDSGFAISPCLEQLYPIEWWAHAEQKGWLEARQPTDFLDSANLNRIACAQTTLADLCADHDWQIVAKHNVREEHKAEWANWVIGLSDEEIVQGLPHLIALTRGALERLGALDRE